MADWPANGEDDWNTKMLAYLAVSFNTDGTPKKSVFGFSASTDEDSEANAMLKLHAYKAATDGEVSATMLSTGAGHGINGYLGTTDDPVGAGTLIQAESVENDRNASVSFLVAKDEYFEITCSVTPVIHWKSIGTLSKPVDQD